MRRIVMLIVMLAGGIAAPESAERKCSDKDLQSYRQAIAGVEREIAFYHERIAKAEREIADGRHAAAEATNKRIVKDSEKQIGTLEKKIREYRGRCDRL